MAGGLWISPDRSETNLDVGSALLGLFLHIECLILAKGLN